MPINHYLNATFGKFYTTFDMIGMMAVAALIFALILAALPHLLWLLLFIIGKPFHFHPGYAPFGWTALALTLTFVIIMVYGIYIGRFRLAVTEMEYSHPDVPAAFDGYRIVHISDLHLGTFDDNKKKLTRIVERINSLNPDLVCFTGDLVSLGVKETEPYVQALSSIKAADGVASVLGNHDFFIYSFRGRPEAEQNAEVEKLVNVERNEMGWKLLRNESLTISRGEEKITILGVDNQDAASDQGFHTISRGDLRKAMEGTDGFRILLSHDPSHWGHEVVPDTDIQLTLSGHTHAAQVRILGWTPAKWVFKETDGRYDRDGQTLYVNIGLGGTAPIRIGAKPEITLITLTPQE